MKRNLYTASDQWAMRPPDERFTTLTSLLKYTKAKRDIAQQKTVRFNRLGVAALDDDVVLTSGSRHANFTNWSFQQFCLRVGAPFSWCEQLPAELAVKNIDYALSVLDDDERDSQILFANDGSGMTVRSFHGSAYTRVWDYEVVEKLMELLPEGWDVPPAYDPTNFGGPMQKGNSGLYCGDRDMFIFMVNEENRIARPGSDKGLARGFFVGQSEVGFKAYKFTRFLYEYVCGNHICLGVEEVEDFSIRHVGDIVDRATELLTEQLERYSEAEARPTERRIKAAMDYELGASDEEVINYLYEKRVLPKKAITAALEEAILWEDNFGSPWSAWGMASGVTVVSQKKDFAGDRVLMDVASQKILKLVN